MSSSKWFAPTPTLPEPSRAEIWDEPTPGEYVLKSPRDTESRPFPEPVLVGWRCPGCGAMWGPSVTGCERCNGTEDDNVANRLFVDAALKIEGVLSAQEFVRRGGGKGIDVVVDNVISGAGWEVTKLQCRIEDQFPAVTIDVHLRQDRGEEA